MHSMFGKLFFAFWFATILSGVVFFILAFNLRIGPMHEEHRLRWERERSDVMSHALTLYGTSAAAAFEKSGKLPNIPDNKGSSRQVRVFLFSSDGKELVPGAPQEIREAVSRGGAGAAVQPGPAAGATAGPAPSSRPESRPAAFRNVVVVPVHGPSGATYLAATRTWVGPPDPKPPFKGNPWPLPPHLWLQLFITFVV